MEGERWIPTFVGMTETSNEIAALFSKAHDNTLFSLPFNIFTNHFLNFLPFIFFVIQETGDFLSII